jgi:AraC-like DNA-binding protein
MKFIFDERPSDSAFVDRIWHTQSEGTGSFLSVAVCHWEMVIQKQNGNINLTVRGPETKATSAYCSMDGEWLGIVFKLGTFMPHLPSRKLVDRAVDLPEASSKSFWLHGSAWQFPNYENVDTFVARLVHEGLLVHESVVEAALQGHLKGLSLRSVQRRFLHTTGLTHKTIQQIERARYAVALLEQGISIPTVAHKAGYFDQAHLTNSLKHFRGQTPAQILRLEQPE